MGAKKPVVATVDDLKALEEKLRSDITAGASTSSDALQTVERKIQQALGALDNAQNFNNEARRSDLIDAKAALRKYTEECVAALDAQISQTHVAPLKKEISDINQALSSQIAEADANMRALLTDEMTALCTRFDDEITSMRAEFTTNLEDSLAEAAEALVSQRAELDGIIAEVKKDHVEHKEEAHVKYAHSAAFVEFQAEQKMKDEKQDERADLRLAEIYVDIGLVKEAVEFNKKKADSDTKNVAADAAAAVDSLTTYSTTRLDKLDDETSKLFGSMSLVESLCTKRVEWVVHSASKKLKADWGLSGNKLHTGWFSPKFDAAGCQGLQLELQLFRVTDVDLEGKKDLGNLAAFLWACKGITLVYKLYIGTKSMVMEKTFNGRVPYGTPRLAWLHEQINREDDTLRIGVEIMEVIREVEHPIKPPPPPPKPISDDQTAVAAYNAAIAAAKLAVEGSLFYKRHINNRLGDQVQKEVQLMRSRMVRKIEWRVQHASLLRNCFIKDEAICSPHFSAAGVENLQFVLYPSGHHTATEGFCSLYVYGPVGASIRAQLWMGKQVRSISHSFDESGAVGRSNFCNFGTIVEAGDDVPIKLEIEEALQDMKAAAMHIPEDPGDRRTIGELEGNDGAIESIVKLTRAPGVRHVAPHSAGPGLEDQLCLPGLWTPKRLKDGPDIPAGFKTFDEMKDIKATRQSPGAVAASESPLRPASAARPGSAAGPGRIRKTTASGSASSPQLPAARPQSGLRKLPG